MGFSKHLYNYNKINTASLSPQQYATNKYVNK